MLRSVGVITKILVIILLSGLPIGCNLAALAPGRAIESLAFGTLWVMPLTAAGMALGLPLLLLLKWLGRFSTLSLFIVAMFAGAVVGLGLGLVNIEAPPDAVTPFNPRMAAIGVVIGAGLGAWGACLWLMLFGDPGKGRPQAATLSAQSSSE